MLIVLAHNSLFSEAAPKVFNIMYIFHVACFLLMPFLYSYGDFSWNRLADKFARYLVPHFLFFGLACVVYFILFIPKQSTEVLEWLISVVMAVTFSSETTYNEASGFRLFWFLPAILTLILVRSVFLSAGAPTRGVILALALGVHLTLGLLPQSYLAYVPWGLPIVLFVFPVGLVAEQLWRKFKDTPAFYWVCGIGFLACGWIAWNLDRLPALAGEPRVYSILEPGRLLFQDAFLIFAFFALCGLAMVLPDKGFRKLGMASLFVFLTHGFVWQALLRTGIVDWLSATANSSFVTVVASYALTMAICLMLHNLLRARDSLWSFFFPRSASVWRLPRFGRS